MSGALNLNVVTNYLPTLEEDDVEIMNSYILIIQNLLNHIHTNITITKEEYLKYIIIYGIESITHIYKLLLLYTKNKALTLHHCDKCVLFYVEFITQIGDDNHSFLQLTSKDAIMFLYKKTLFELDETYVKDCSHSTEHKEKIERFHLLSKLFVNMMRHSLYYYQHMDKLMIQVQDIYKIIILHKEILLEQPNEFYDNIGMLTPFIDSPITCLNKILQIYRKSKNINVLDIFNKLIK
jgi:hypothetical protein